MQTVLLSALGRCRLALRGAQQRASVQPLPFEGVMHLKPCQTGGLRANPTPLQPRGYAAQTLAYLLGRVPLALRGAQQRITPDVQIGCVSCASGDGRFGGPVWWNTPLGEEEAAPEEHRAQWAQPVRSPCCVTPGLVANHDDALQPAV